MSSDSDRASRSSRGSRSRANSMHALVTTRERSGSHSSLGSRRNSFPRISPHRDRASPRLIRRQSQDSLVSDSSPVSPPSSFSTTKLCLFVLILVGGLSVPLLFLNNMAQLPTQVDVQAKLARWINQDEITIQRDPRTHQWGMHYSENLLLISVDEGVQSRLDGLPKYLSRRITHANGILVTTVEAFRALESSVEDRITLRFAPLWFQVGSSVKVSKRVNFRSGDFVEAGTKGVIVRVPGELEGSIAAVKTPGVGVWDVLPGQIEPDASAARFSPGMLVRTTALIVFESGSRVEPGVVGTVLGPGEVKGAVAEVKVGGHVFDAMAGQIEALSHDAAVARTPAPPPATTEEVLRMLEELGHQQYAGRMLAYGLDKLEFVAAASPRDGVALRVKPVHWQRIVVEAKRRVPLSGRGRSGLEQLFTDLGEKANLPRVLGYGIDRLDQLAKAEAKDGAAMKFLAPQWSKLVTEAQNRLNMTQVKDDIPQTEEHRQVLRVLQNVGMGRHYRRYIVFGLDSAERIAKSQDIATAIGLTKAEFDIVQKEAVNVLAGKVPVMYISTDPEGEKEGDLKEHVRLAREYDAADERAEEAYVERAGGGGATGGGGGARVQVAVSGRGSILGDVVAGAAGAEASERVKRASLVNKLSSDETRLGT